MSLSANPNPHQPLVDVFSFYFFLCLNARHARPRNIKMGPMDIGFFPHVFVRRCFLSVQKTVAALKRKKAIGVFFSAQWSPACQTFAPRLAAFYNACKKKDKDALEARTLGPWQSETRIWWSKTYLVPWNETSCIRSARLGRVSKPSAGKTFAILSCCLPVAALQLMHYLSYWSQERVRAFFSSWGYARATILNIAIWLALSIASAVNRYADVSSVGQVVFVSTDRNDAAFREYLNTMPWWVVLLREAPVRGSSSDSLAYTYGSAYQHFLDFIEKSRSHKNVLAPGNIHNLLVFVF